MSTGDAARVSVIIPVHNAEPFLEQCLASVTAQSPEPLQIIAVDDGSSDGSEKVLRRWADEGLVELVRHDKARGPSAARNAGMEIAAGDYLAFVDADDTVRAGRFVELLAAADATGAEIVGSGFDVVGPGGQVQSYVPFPLPDGVLHDHAAVREELHRGFATRLLWYPFRCLYSRSMLQREQIRFDPDLRKGEDSLFNLVALDSAAGVSAVAGSGYRYRQHGGSLTATALPDEAGNLDRLARMVGAVHRDRGFDQRATADLRRQVLRSDLPTALTRLARSPDLATSVAALLAVPVVRDAFTHHRIRDLQVPWRVRALLALCRWSTPRTVAVALRAIIGRPRGWGERRSGGDASGPGPGATTLRQ